MDYANVVVFIILGIIVSGFIYYNFIFPRRVEREEKEKNSHKGSL
ncbi:flagellar biosynthesis/type III secretory pathway M-ring protein FliF/YscJ [Clostridium punense]|uniref:Flagellar biosynthesis/type III secretory pathway M-ring protein FliF/YscJ n=1 Tax=Clostridium punense TaxID=1054297 RepID=A0ABS4K6W8_9CLOT|nr:MULTISPECIES: hypothetical protein [Clostridium]EQB88336.1 hypothetical protein M918_04720 [Clostridium sp. BL8]MBP2023528.1 flagellar biosynthesis/type III secretory pathway M-ring protein FliF/YscJ [Clostridium punense]